MLTDKYANILRRELSIHETSPKSIEDQPGSITVPSRSSNVIIRSNEDDMFSASAIQPVEDDTGSFTWPSKLELKKYAAYNEFRYEGANPKRLIAKIEEFIQDLGYTVRPKTYNEEKEVWDEVVSMRGGLRGAKAALKKERKPPIIPAPRRVRLALLIIGILLSFSGIITFLPENLGEQNLSILSGIPSVIPTTGIPTWIPGVLFIIILILSSYRRSVETLLTQEILVLFEGQLSKGTRIRSMEEKVQEIHERSGERGMTIQETYIMGNVDIRFGGHVNRPERTVNVQNDIDLILKEVRTTFS